MFQTHYNEKTKIWSGNDMLPLFNSKLSLGEIVFRALITNGPRIAQINDDCGTQMSFDEIRLKAVRAAINLQKYTKCQRGNVIGLMASNSKDVAPIVFASLFIGCPLNTLDPSFGKTELIHMLNTTKPSLMICDVGVCDLVEKCSKELGLKITMFSFGDSNGNASNVESLFVETDDEKGFLPAKTESNEQVALIVCSSGTTGPSKGVCLMHTALANQMNRISLVNSDDVMLCFSRLYWISGIMTLITGTLFGAKRIITTEAFSPELGIRLIEKYKVTYLLCPPYHIALFLKSELIQSANLSSIKYAVIGGSKIPLDMPEQWNKYSDVKNFHSAYGFSEVNGIISIDYPQSGKKGCVGRLSNGCLVKIIDEHGNRCGPNVDGEICVKLSYKSIGYYGNKDATKSMFDDEDFILSGDIGHFDDDGDLFFVDRKKDLLKYRNFPLTPAEIEEVLIKHPDIESVCVVGIPDGMGSDLPAASIIRNKNAMITEEEIFDMVSNQLADQYKLRGGVYFVESFPVSSSGKILRRKIEHDILETLKQKI